MGDHTTESAFLCGEKAWVFKAPAGVEFELFTGFKDGDALKPDAVTLTDEGRLFSFSSLAPGNYRYTVSGEGYYAAVCNLAVTGLEEAKEREIDVDPGRKAGHGFEPSQPVRKYTDALYEKAVRADDETWKDFAPLFTTPSFAPGKARHEFTSQSELEAYLNGQITASKDAYQFTLTYSGKNHYRLPLVVFTKTDLTGVSNYEDAAEKVRNNGKLTVHYQAQIHGNEPAPSEAALIYIHKLLTEDAFRDQLLERINLYVIPRLNPDGAEAFIRNELKENLNMNRDYMALQSAEVIGSVTAAKVFDPFVVIDAHEYTVENDRESSPYNDILMRTSAGMNKGSEAAAAEAEMMLSCFRKLKEHGLRASGYPDLSGRGGGAVVNGFNPILATTYFGLNGAFSFLVESRGIHDGRFTWKRRLSAQHITVGSLIEYAAEHAEMIRNVISNERKRIIGIGAADGPEADLVLECSISKDEKSAMVWERPVYDYATGELLDEQIDFKIFYFDTAVSVRPRAKRYYFPKGEDFEAELRRLLELHDIRYTETEKNYTAAARQYLGSYEKATVSETKTVCFPDGAILVPMDQINANIAAYLFEPDFIDSKDGVIPTACARFIPCQDGAFPIYRN